MPEIARPDVMLDASGNPLIDDDEPEISPWQPEGAPEIGSPLPPVKRLSRRGFAHKAFRVLGGGALAIGAVTLLGVNPKEAAAYTCSCRVYYTGSWSCEYNCRGIRTGRVSFWYRGYLTIGTAGCGSACDYWGVWHCDTSACPASNCPNYC